MKKDILVQLNMSALALLNATTAKQLELAVVDTSQKLIDATYGQFYLFEKDHYKKIFSSSIDIRKVTIVKNVAFRPYLRYRHTFVLKQNDLKKMHIEHLPTVISSIIVVPYVHKNVFLGFLVLYRDKPNELPTEMFDSLRLLSKTGILAIAKLRMQEDAKKSLEIRDRFISLASHELRTPLTSLHGYIQLLHAKMNGKDGIESRWVNELYVESNRLTNLVKELLDVNRIKQGQFAFVFNEILLRDVIKKALDNIKNISSDDQIVFQNKIIETPIKVVGDFDKLVEMVKGIIGNAIKFSKSDQKIYISLKSTQGMLSLIVKDQGKGMCKKDLTAIFDGFYKSSSGNGSEGMGVGLMLAKHIVENHRGKIKISSKENKGTKVEIILPTIK